MTTACKHPSARVIEAKDAHRWCRKCGALYCFIERLGWCWVAPAAAATGERPAPTFGHPCYCSDRMSGGLPCSPGKCPNAPPEVVLSYSEAQS